MMVGTVMNRICPKRKCRMLLDFGFELGDFRVQKGFDAIPRFPIPRVLKLKSRHVFEVFSFRLEVQRAQVPDTTAARLQPEKKSPQNCIQYPVLIRKKALAQFRAPARNSNLSGLRPNNSSNSERQHGAPLLEHATSPVGDRHVTEANVRAEPRMQ
jgi:hypothetical protein